MPRAMVITEFFPPLSIKEMQRVPKFLTYLPDFGWEPLVLTLKNKVAATKNPFHPGGVPGHLRIKSSRAPVARGLFLRRNLYPLLQISKKEPYPGISQMLKLLDCLLIPDELAAWLPFGRVAGKRLLKKHEINLIFSIGTSHTCHLIGKSLSRHMQLPWIADLQFPRESDFSHANARCFFRLQIDEIFRRLIIHQAQWVVVNSEKWRGYLLSKFPKLPRNRIQVITDGYDPNDYPLQQEEPTDGPFKIALLSPPSNERVVRSFVKALQKIFQKHPGWQEEFKIIWQGPVRTEEFQTVKKLGLKEQFSFMGPQPYPKMLHHLQTANILLLPTQNEMLHNITAWTTLYQYLGTGLPIMAIGEAGSLRKFVRDEKLGRDFDSTEIEAIAAALTYWFVEYKNGSLKRRQREMRQYQYYYLTQKLARIFNHSLQHRISFS
ncbi:MAG: hypothetical protein D6814_13120 [Calditrichaeota bacterium]|nr:MAG: hypothetical protein D6814_13120 [Calditrichota bacterium]